MRSEGISFFPNPWIGRKVLSGNNGNPLGHACKFTGIFE
jgi:hypothetical protein